MDNAYPKACVNKDTTCKNQAEGSPPKAEEHKGFYGNQTSPCTQTKPPLRAAPLHGEFAGQVSLPAPSGRESRRETKADTSKPALTSAQMTAALLLPRSHWGVGFNLPFKGIPAQAALSFAYYRGHVCAWNTNAGSLLAAGHRLQAPRTSVIACQHLCPYQEGCSQHSACSQPAAY